MKISVVIPNYNGKNLLEKNLPRVLDECKSYDLDKWEIIIVDDASTDNSVDYLSNIKYKISNIKLLKNDKNLGFAPTVNRGVRAASGEIVILFNTDVGPEAGFLEPLLAHFKDEKIFAVGCMDKSIEQDRVILRGRGLGKWRRGFLVHRKGEVDKTDTLWVSGGSGAFRKSIWDKLGGFNELYAPFYWEDIDISYRALKSGYKIIFEPKSTVIHEHEKGAIKQKYSPFRIKTIAYKNQFIFVWLNGDSSTLVANLFWLPYHFLKTLFGLEIAFYLGFTKAFVQLPKILSSRKQNKKLFIKTDQEVIQPFI